jgi:hypothetical protein
MDGKSNLEAGAAMMAICGRLHESSWSSRQTTLQARNQHSSQPSVHWINAVLSGNGNVLRALEKIINYNVTTR